MDATNRRVRIGIYGTGNFANRTHLPNLDRIADAELVAASDPNPENLAATAKAAARTVTASHFTLNGFGVGQAHSRAAHRMV